MIVKNIQYPKSRIIVTPDLEGVSIEQMVRKAMQSNEPIEANAKIGYSERKDGVLPMYDIRFDKFNAAMNASNKVYADAFTMRENTDKGMILKDGVWINPESAQGEA